MYVPKHNRIDDLDELHRFVRRYGFATLISNVDDAPFATHLPFLVDREGDRFVLRAHMARANPQWQTLESQSSLTIFTGPHAYVSAAWYCEPDRDVPTWNYTAVHAVGRARIVEDPADVRALVARLSQAHESTLPQNEPRWSADLLGDDRLDPMLRAIVAFDIPVDRLEGKYKLSQNRTPEDRRRAIAGLEGADDAASHEVASLMRDLVD